ncbi:MAG: DUF6491 family protein [Caulobacteraceae bacterium]
MRASGLIKLAAAAALVTGLGASTMSVAADPASPRSPRTCFWANNVSNYAYVDDSTINIRVGARQVYQLTTFGRCNDIDWSHRIRLETHGFNSVCSPYDVDLIVPTSTGPIRCAVRGIRQLTPDEIASLPSRQRP